MLRGKDEIRRSTTATQKEKKNKKKRKPLTDLTNVPSSSSSSCSLWVPLILLKEPRPNPKPPVPRERSTLVAEGARVVSAYPPGVKESILDSGKNSRMMKRLIGKRHSVPCQKPKKRYKSEAINILPLDFVERQQAYFAEVDAFELPEEVVSESELE